MHSWIRRSGTADDPALPPPPPARGRGLHTIPAAWTFWRRLRRHRLAMAGAVITLAMALFALLLPYAITADPTAIPELLLKAVSHSGDGRMSGVTYVQRLDTVGGLAPTAGCDTAGATARVDYTATYYFYAANDDDAS